MPERFTDDLMRELITQIDDRLREAERVRNQAEQQYRDGLQQLEEKAAGLQLPTFGSGVATRDIVIIMVTALHEVSDFERAVECGTNDFITKPVQNHELAEALRRWLVLQRVT